MLSRKQRQFVTEYLACFNASEAARRAGYSERSAASIGHENLIKPEISEEISRALAATAMSKTEVLTRLADQARGTFGDFLTFVDADGTPLTGDALRQMPAGTQAKVDLMAGVRAGKTHLVRKFKQDEGGVSVELYSAQDALLALAKHWGLLGSVAGTVDDPVHTVEMTLTEWRAEQARRRADALSRMEPPPAGDDGADDA